VVAGNAFASSFHNRRRLPGESWRRCLKDLAEELERSGRHRELAQLLEAGLVADPPEDAFEIRALRLRLVALYEHVLHDPQRALSHLEALLAGDPLDEAAEQLAVQL